MKNLLFLIILLLFYSCNKPKTVLICGDHICINKAEAEQYFEKNLSLEVQIIDEKKSDEINLIELNLNKGSEGKKKITLSKKKETKQRLKVLTKSDIKKKKVALKKNKKIKNEEKSVKKKSHKSEIVKRKKIQKSKNEPSQQVKIVNKVSKKITDICTILDDCSIDEISKYLVKQGRDKKFPDITMREN